MGAAVAAGVRQGRETATAVVRQVWMVKCAAAILLARVELYIGGNGSGLGYGGTATTWAGAGGGGGITVAVH